MITSQLVELYRRLAGRRYMNARSADKHWNLAEDRLYIAESTIAVARRDSYQNAINDLCSAFGVTEDELRREVS